MSGTRRRGLPGEVRSVRPQVAERQRQRSRRPIEADEVAYLEALGAEVLRQRRVAGMSRRFVARHAGLGETTVRDIEWGARRTRRITLAGIVAVLMGDVVGSTVVQAEVDRLAALAGPTLAPDRPELESRRARKVRRYLRRVERDEQERQRRREEDARVRRAVEWAARYGGGPS